MNISLEYIDTIDQQQIAILTLNRPSALNALNFDMIQTLLTHLQHLQVQESVSLVILKGAGEKSFCAGGDVRAARAEILKATEVPNPGLCDYFSAEYQLDYLIHTFKKPIITLAHGITMGGGLGLMAGSKFRVCTPDSVFAMPEVLIGLFPDVGANFFLHKMPANIGLFLALTGVSFYAQDALLGNLVDYCIDAHHFTNIETELSLLSYKDVSLEDIQQKIQQTLANYHQEPTKACILPNLDALQQLAQNASLDSFIEALDHLPASNPLFASAQQNVHYASPTSLALTFAYYQKSKSWSLAQVLRQDLDLILRCAQAEDFAEGVRALLVEKDKQPKWQAPSLALIEQHFTSFFTPETHLLKHLA